MVEVWVEILVSALSALFLGGWVFFLFQRFEERSFEIENEIDEIKQGIEVVATVLQRLPEMVPQFSINQSPLGQILEFFQNQQRQQGSYSDAQLRDSTGRYSDGTQTEEVEASAEEIHGD